MDWTSSSSDDEAASSSYQGEPSSHQDHSTTSHQGEPSSHQDHSTTSHQGEPSSLQDHSTTSHQGEPSSLQDHSTTSHQGEPSSLQDHSTTSHQGESLPISADILVSANARNDDLDLLYEEEEAATTMMIAPTADTSYESKADDCRRILNILRDTSNLRRWYFLGLFSADGLNCGRARGFGFRSTELQSFQDFFHFMDVQSPLLRFYAQGRIEQERIGAGDYGKLYWMARSHDLATLLDSTGLPSSRVKDTNLDRLQAFFSDEGKDDPNGYRFLLWLLGFLEGDGCVKWRVVPDTWPPQIRLLHIALDARDDQILRWLKTTLEQQFGFVRLSLAPTDSTCRYQRLIIPGFVPIHQEIFQMGLDKLEDLGLVLSGKLQFLKALIENDSIPSTSIAPRISFRDYMGDGLNDPYYRIIAQDVYPLHLYALNNFLRGLQMEPVTSTHDKTLVARIIDNGKKLDQSSSDPKVINALRYYKCLDKRTRPTMPKEYQPKPLAYKCPHCIKTFNTDEALQTHVRVHNDTPKVTCDVCGYLFPQDELDAHINDHKLKELTCPIDECGEIFSTQAERQNHIAVVHIDELHLCDICGNAYTSKRVRDHHVKTVHGEDDKVPCLIANCGKTFKSQYNLDVHMQWHKGRRHACHIEGCGKSFHTSSGLNDHMNVHNAIKVQCTMTGCGKEFPSPRALQRHQRIVHKPPRFPCTSQGCNQAFRSADDREAHINRHHRIRDKACSFLYCDATFAVESEWVLHRRSTHESLVYMGYLHDDITRPHERFDKKPLKVAGNESIRSRGLHVMFSDIEHEKISEIIKQAKDARITIRVHESLGDIQKISHLVMPTYETRLVKRTQAYLKAVLHKKLVVSLSWLEETIQHQTIQNEIEYEVLGDRIAGATLAPNRSRESHQRLIWEGLRICFLGAKNLKCLREAYALTKSSTGATAYDSLPKKGSNVHDHRLHHNEIDRNEPIVIVQDDEHLERSQLLHYKHQVRSLGWLMTHMSYYEELAMNQ